VFDPTRIAPEALSQFEIDFHDKFAQTLICDVFRLILVRPPEAERLAHLRTLVETHWAQGAERRAHTVARYRPPPGAAGPPSSVATTDTELTGSFLCAEPDSEPQKK
jgi:hypothetical protein